MMGTMAEKETGLINENGLGVLSSDSSAIVKLDLKGPPNGGLKAWTQILGAFFLYFNTWGKLSDSLFPLPFTRNSRQETQEARAN